MTVKLQKPTVPGTATDPVVHLRVLATTDLHAHLLPFDYFTDTRQPDIGLALLGELIAGARAGSPNVVLFDNGDTLQGAPLADAAVAKIVPAGRAHPMITAMNALGFDAATLGNHDFDFGLAHLTTSLDGASFPVVCANARRMSGEPFLPPRTILQRDVVDTLGQVHRLRIGVTGALPPQVALWNRPILKDRLVFDDILAALQVQVDALRADGADVVVALAHSGCGTLDALPGAENVALQVARMPGVDAVVAGHTHKLKSEPGTVAGGEAGGAAPLVQPGAFGSHLGCIDLTLHRAPEASDHRWLVHHSQAANFPSTGRRAHGAIPQRRMLPDYAQLRGDLAREHAATRAFVAQPLGDSAVALETYFSVLAPCAATQLVADAQRAAANPLIERELGDANLPVLSAVAPFKAGGRSGPRNYTDIPPGPLRLRHAADLYLYPNMLSVIRMTGQGIRDWLERSASLFFQIDPGATAPQLLIDHDFAPYNFDRLLGLRYQIDVSRPPRTNAEGDRIFDTEGRIRDLRLADGRALSARDEVLVITNSYRAAGGGYMHGLSAAQEVVTAQFSVRDAVARYIMDTSGPVAPVVEPTFNLRPLGGVTVVFETGPGALNHPARLADLGLTSAPGESGSSDSRGTASGFQRFILKL